MNTITSTYSNSASVFSTPAGQKTPLGNSPEPPSKNDLKPSPPINSSPADPVDQPLEINKYPDQSNPENNETDDPQKHSKPLSGSEQGFTPAEIKLIEELKKADTKVRQHEMAHIAAGGKYITSGANFSYQRGPNGKNYAVGGEVGIDTAPVPGDPEATITKMRQVKNAALAPADPSSQDLKVAANAMSEVSKAMSELILSQAEDRAAANEEKAFGPAKEAAGSYEKTNTLPPKKISSFQIAV
nr:SprA-related family protein [Desulfobacula sp.]